MAAAEAQSIIDAFRTLTFTITPTSILLQDAYRLAVAHQRTVYDALYLALSIREKCPLVTADEKLANALIATFPNMVWVRNWP